jgi:hypothetical protein
LVLITGVPLAIASSWTTPNASARVTDGNTSTSAACIHAFTSPSESAPGNSNVARPAGVDACAVHARRIGPSPAITMCTDKDDAA